MTNMTYGEAIKRLTAYRTLHGKKLDKPYKRNPILNLSAMVDQWVSMCEAKPSEDTVSDPVQRTITRITATPIPAAQIIVTPVTDETLYDLENGDVDVIVGNRVIRLRRR